MAPIDDTIADLNSREPGERYTLIEVAENGALIARRSGGGGDESELILYIEKLTKRALPPTRRMIQNFASAIAKREVSESWVTRFINRHQDKFVSKRTSAMDRTRHQDDSLMKYEAYFDLLHQKLKECCLEAGDIYNMDEKGFLIGIVGTGKRIFSKRQWDKKEVRASLQDGSRLIYTSARGAIRSN
ncbi:hypothetical protein COCCADRAFT_10601 [Bipolaris zeicola 26-R-13]|uniref:HTH CENPB-type domain-containing protein n=1 Tax=Cochliobolus carbonum (strain 26-R-13) TaxID=930089 RepID=W6XHS6_COCC2|nr:uncharacterized protein COCCADRAFT_10601 [Bipolaris zeicola 26-R-13]EUC26627.1 hypothetical protein COCCADRAFT_10601 [Bipolaris zeicola 26-R-13]